MTRSTLQKYWWALTARGIIAIIFAIITLAWTKNVLEFLILLFSLFILANGIINIFSAFDAKDAHEHWWVHILKGIFDIVLAYIAFVYPTFTAIFFIYMVAVWALIMGAIEIWLSSTIIKEISERWVLMITGIFSIIISLLFVIFPLSSIVTLTWLIGLFALISGIGLVVFGLQIKK